MVDSTETVRGEPCNRCGIVASPLIETGPDSDEWVCVGCAHSHELAIYGDVVGALTLATAEEFEGL